MAGAKKKKKPAANPARGFATTSIASKPRPEVVEEPEKQPTKAEAEAAALSAADTATNGSSQTPQDTKTAAETTLSPEEFERQLEEAQLQIIVDKHATKVKRDAQRQRSRLETDRRLVRGQADSVNSSKWLPQELMDHILDLIQAENRFAASNVSSDNASSAKMPPEEEMIAKLWTLQETLTGVGFPASRVEAVSQFILDISASISVSGKDLIWGLEEALEWLARECPTEELPPYEPKAKPVVKDTPTDSPLPSRPVTPKAADGRNGRQGNKGAAKGRAKKNSPSTTKKLQVTYDSDIEPDNLVPAFVDAKAKLLEFDRLKPVQKGKTNTRTSDDEMAVAKLEAKISKIQSDVLFDSYTAEQQWQARRIPLEKELAEAKKLAEAEAEIEDSQPSEDTKDAKEEDGEINEEAERIAAEILAEAEGSDDGIEGLFDSLPQTEVDATTGQSQTVISSADGVKTIIRDFGKWTGVSPRRALDEACRSRDSGVRVNYVLVSESSYANKHAVDIVWSKPQEVPLVVETSYMQVAADPNRFTLTMTGVATPDSKQSESYAATAALFYIFSGNAREEKVGLRLPAAWKDLWTELAENKKSQLDSQDRAVVRVLRDMVRKRHDQELEDGVILQGAFRGRATAKSSHNPSEAGSQDRAKQVNGGDEIYRKIWADKASTRKFQTMLEFRKQLPMWSFKQRVLDAVDQNQVVIVCGETGCGKSTQVPAFLLEHALSQGKDCKVYCTEPRRISALSLAKRVSEELGENKGDLGTSRSLVGYSIRLESNTSRETRLVYATTGIVMRMLEGSNELQGVTHLVLDEVHERTIDSDFLLIVLKRLMVHRKDLKVVLMSATVDADRFSSYLGGAPVLNVPGRTFPVEVKFLEDAVELTGYTVSDTPPDKMVDLDDDAPEPEAEGPKGDLTKSLSKYSAKTRMTMTQIDEYRIEPDLIVQLIAKIASDSALQDYSKAILVFLPGIAEIRTLNDYLLGDPRFQKDWLVYPLHSTIATEDQEAAFLVPPQGMRKIVLATNIAETGITIPDVTCVIDTGKHREMRYDERRQLSRLIDTFISRANAKQRRGRAGRVQHGLCFHMFSKHRHDNLMNDQQTPEMLRLSLQDLAIRVKICKIGGIEETLSGALDPPSAKNMRRAIDALIDVRALTQAEDLTPLGHQLARLPLDVFLGKLILVGSVFKCLDMALTVAAILSSKSPFSAPFGQRAQADNAKKAFGRGDSDLLTVYNAYLAWKRVCQANSGMGTEFQFCRKNFLAQQTLANIEDLKGQLLVSLADSGFLSLTEDERRTLSKMRFASGGRRRHQQFFEVPSRVNLHSENDLITSSVIAWSFYPKMLVRDTPGTKGLRNIGNNQSISLHPTSINRGRLDIKWLSYYHIMQSKTVYHAHETTATDPFSISLLCGDVRCDMFSGVIVLDGNRGRFALPDWKTMLVLKVLRTRLRELLTRSFKQPGKMPTTQQEKWFDVWQRLFTQEFGQEKSIGPVAVGRGA